jgi:hypothetical protein
MLGLNVGNTYDESKTGFRLNDDFVLQNHDPPE